MVPKKTGGEKTGDRSIFLYTTFFGQLPPPHPYPQGRGGRGRDSPPLEKQHSLHPLDVGVGHAVQGVEVRDAELDGELGRRARGGSGWGGAPSHQGGKQRTPALLRRENTLVGLNGRGRKCPKTTDANDPTHSALRALATAVQWWVRVEALEFRGRAEDDHRPAAVPTAVRAGLQHDRRGRRSRQAGSLQGK